MSNNCGGAPNAKAASGIPDSAWQQKTVTDVWDIFYGHSGCGVCGVSAIDDFDCRCRSHSFGFLDWLSGCNMTLESLQPLSIQISLSLSLSLSPLLYNTHKRNTHTPTHRTQSAKPGRASTKLTESSVRALLRSPHPTLQGATSRSSSTSPRTTSGRSSFASVGSFFPLDPILYSTCIHMHTFIAFHLKTHYSSQFHLSPSPSPPFSIRRRCSLRLQPVLRIFRPARAQRRYGNEDDHPEERPGRGTAIQELLQDRPRVSRMRALRSSMVVAHGKQRVDGR